VHVLAEAAVVTQSQTARGEIVVAREHGAAVAHGGQVLRRIERERRGHAEAPHGTAGPGRALRLGAILEEPQAAGRGHVLDRGHVDGLAVQVNGHAPDRARRDPGVRGRLALVLLALWPQDVPPAFDGRQDRLLDLVVHRGTGQWNRHTEPPSKRLYLPRW